MTDPRAGRPIRTGAIVWPSGEGEQRRPPLLLRLFADTDRGERVVSEQVMDSHSLILGRHVTEVRGAYPATISAPEEQPAVADAVQRVTDRTSADRLAHDLAAGTGPATPEPGAVARTVARLLDYAGEERWAPLVSALAARGVVVRAPDLAALPFVVERGRR